MTTTNAKEVLKQYQLKMAKVDEIQEECDKFMTRATKMTASFNASSVISTTISDKVSTNAVKIADLKNEWQELLLEAEKEKIKLYRVIMKIDEPYRKILVARYIHRKDFEEIAESLNYSYSWIIHKHKIAVEKFDEVLQNYDKE